MQILLKIPEDLQKEKYSQKDKNELAEELYEMLEDAYIDATTPDCYLRGIGENIAEVIGLTLGSEFPDVIINEARIWNAEIDDEFEECMVELNAQSIEKNNIGSIYAKKWHTIDSSLLYKLKKAVMALSDTLSIFANKAVYTGCCLNPILNDENLEKIKENPAQYAIVHIYPK